tara:strand:- start:162 stop:347 length:186 start_codon:yes stop_codon:yes gene_type:complete
LELFSKSLAVSDEFLTNSTTNGVIKKIDIIITLDSKVLDIAAILLFFFSLFFYQLRNYFFP